MPSSNDDGALAAAAASAAGVAGGPCSSPNDSLEGGSPGTTERRQRSETSSNGVDGKRQHRISSSLTIPAETKTPVSKRAKVAEAEAECEGNSVVTPTCCPRVRDDDPHTPHDGMEDGANRRRSKPEKQVGEEEAKRRAEGRHEFAKNLLKTEARELTIPSSSQKRSDYLSWDEYFMAVAFLSALRSKDPNTQVGACIVNADRRIVGIGYNGFPRNCCDDLLPWSRRSRGLEELHTKYPYMCHAEMNAIMNKCSDDVVGAAVYVALFPCNECAKLIVQSGIREVVYMNYTYDDPDSDECRAARVLFGLAGVRCRRHIPRAGGGGGENNRTLTIDFGEPAVLDRQTVAVNSTTTAAAAATGRDDEKEEKAERSRRQRMVELLKREAGYDADDPPSSSSPSFGGSDNISSVVRSDHLPWDTYFMAVAFLSARRSKDPNTQVGACIVNADRRIVAVGYNGFPRGCSDDVLPWSGRGVGRHELHTKYPYVCHAEMNAILNKCSANVRGATIYVALFPCNDCAKLIIQAGIRQVVYVSNKYHDTDGCRASRIMFTMAGVEVRQHRPAMRYIHLELRPPTKSSPCKDESD